MHKPQDKPKTEINQKAKTLKSPKKTTKTESPKKTESLKSPKKTEITPKEQYGTRFHGSSINQPKVRDRQASSAATPTRHACKALETGA